MRSVRTSPLVQRARYTVRLAVDRVDNPEVRKARGLVRRLRTAPPDLLYLGDSTAAWISAEDTDRRRLFEMIESRLPAGVSTHAIFGGSYNAELLLSYLGLLSGVPSARPVVLVALWARGRTIPWIHHPAYGHQRSIAYIKNVPANVPWWRIHAAYPRAGADDFARYYELPHPTVLGELTIGDYVRALKDPDRFRDDPKGRARMIYAFHQGHRLTDDEPGLEAVRALGATLRQLGVPVIAYETPLSVQSGEAHFGTEFRDITEHNYAQLRDSLRAGYGGELPIVASGMLFEPDEFIDPDIADEHLNERGRLRLAELLADALAARLESQSSGRT